MDSEGRAHFPDHASVTRKTCLAVCPEGYHIVAELAGWDMDLHTLSADELDARLGIWSRKDACSLLLAALAEVHANAQMFGGIESTSFKIKWKQLDRRGKRLVKALFGDRTLGA